MIQKTNIAVKDNWDPNGYSFAISNSGKYIAIQYVNQDGFTENGSPNVFVYDTAGREVFSFENSQGGERGVAFWPDERNIIITGCGHMHKFDADGIKQWTFGRKKDFKYLFSDTPLTGLWTYIMGATRQGRYILGYHMGNGHWLIDTHTNISIEAEKVDYNVDWVVFSQDEKFTGIANDVFLKIGGGGAILENASGKIIWNQDREYVLAFHPNSKKFLTLDFNKLIFRVLPNGDIAQEFSLESFGKLTHGVTAAAYSRDGKILAVGPVDNKYVLIFDADRMELLNRIYLDERHYCRIRMLQFSVIDELIIIDFDVNPQEDLWQTGITVWE